MHQGTNWLGPVVVQSDKRPGSLPNSESKPEFNSSPILDITETSLTL
jgi:hypothetical protein